MLSLETLRNSEMESIDILIFGLALIGITIVVILVVLVFVISKQVRSLRRDNAQLRKELKSISFYYLNNFLIFCII